MYKQVLICVLCGLCICDGQDWVQQAQPPVFQQKSVQNIPTELPTNLHNGLAEMIGNFSLELLYFTVKNTPEDNVVIAPLTMWNLLAIVSEGASDRTEMEIRNAARLTGSRKSIRSDFGKIAKWLVDNTTTVELAKINSIYVDKNVILEKDFQQIATRYYDTEISSHNFKDKNKIANVINNNVSQFTHGRITKLVDSSYFDEAKMIILSGVFFRGQWTSPFNETLTKTKPFMDSFGKKLGDVKMMYQRSNFPFANIREIQARVIELPYGVENRLSMLIMLPDFNVSLEDMFKNFLKVPLDKVFKDLKTSQIEFGDDEVDCFIPRFKIESDINMNSVLNNLGIYTLFDPVKAHLPFMARVPLYVSRVVHKAEIDVTEKGTTASAISSAEFANRIGIVTFEANRPFAYMIVEKVTNSIVFGGIYRKPILY